MNFQVIKANFSIFLVDYLVSQSFSEC